MGEAKQMQDRLKADIQAFRQDNTSWKRKIVENEEKIVGLERIVDVLQPLCNGGEKQ